MPDGIFISGTISGIDFIMLGQFTWPEMQQIDHLHWFSMYLSTNAIQWKCWILHSRCEMWDKFSSMVSGIDLIFSGAIYRTRNAKNDHIADLRCIQVQIAPDGNARYCIPNARCEMSFWHSFWHWFNVCRSNFSAQNAIKWSFMPISDVFKYN